MLATCICLNGSLLDQLSCTIVYLHNLFTCTFGRINMSVCLSVCLSVFDTLDHSILLSKLEYYGIRNNALKLFKNYLSNRKQYVVLDTVQSNSVNIVTGVPQGSILGPLLFTIYINYIIKCSEKFKFIMYADDTTLLIQ